MIGSKRRLGVARKCRGNVDFREATAFLDEHGIPWEIQTARGRGHHILLIAGRVRYPLAGTPGRTCPGQVRASLRRRLRAAGIISGGDDA